MAPAGRDAVGRALHAVVPGDYQAYEELLRALATGEVHMLLWQGTPGDPQAQYGKMEVAGQRYAPCVTSAAELAATGWTRGHEVVRGARIAEALYRDRWGLWLDPHAPRGGVGIPWLDLRRVAAGVDRLPAGPLRIGEPPAQAPRFYASLSSLAQATPVVRSLRRAWVRPALGESFLAIGVDLYDNGPGAVAAVRQMMQQVIDAAPEGVAVSTVGMADGYDPIAMWMRAHAWPFFDRAGQPGGGGAAAPPPPAAAQPYRAQPAGYPQQYPRQQGDHAAPYPRQNDPGRSVPYGQPPYPGSG